MAEKRRKVRVGLTAQLYQGQDDDLIAWYRSLPEKQGNQAIKAVLRQGLQLPQSSPQQTDIDFLYSEIETLRQQLRQLPSQTTVVGDNAYLEQLAGWVEQNIQHIMTELRRLDEKIGAAGSTVAEASADTQQASADQLARRQQRLRKNTW
jgi:hypothetical protein